MLSLKDIIPILDRWGEWRTIRDQASKVPDLERRITALESQLSGRRPGDVCPKCGRRTLRVTNAHRMHDQRRGYYSLRSYSCEADDCNFHEQRQE